MAQTMWEWGAALEAVRTARGLSLEDVARLVGLGEHLTAADVAAVEAGRADWAAAVEVTTALDLGLRIGLTAAEELADAWTAGYVARERARRSRV